MKRKLGLSILILFACFSFNTLSHADRVYVTNFNSGSVSVIDTNNNSVVASIPVGQQPRGIALNVDGSFAYCANMGNNTVSVIETSSNAVKTSVEVGTDPYDIEISHSRNMDYVTNQGSMSVSVIDLSNNTIAATILLPFDGIGGVFIYGIGINSTGTRAYVGGHYHEHRLWVVDTATNQTITRLTLSHPYDIAVSPVGNRAYVSRWPHWVSVVDTATNAFLETITVGEEPQGIAVHPDGSRVYLANKVDDTVSVINTTTGSAAPVKSIIASIPVGDAPLGVACNASGSRVYVTNTGDDTVSVIDTASNSVVATVAVGDHPWGIAVGPEQSDEGNGSNCFIATAAYGSKGDPHVLILRAFRDRFLLTNLMGKVFVKAYYIHSPKITESIADNKTAKRLIRIALFPVVGAAWMALKMRSFWIPALVFAAIFCSGVYLRLILVSKKKENKTPQEVNVSKRQVQRLSRPSFDLIPSSMGSPRGPPLLHIHRYKSRFPTILPIPIICYKSRLILRRANNTVKKQLTVFMKDTAEYSAIYGGDECGAGIRGMQFPSFSLKAPPFKAGNFTRKGNKK